MSESDTLASLPVGDVVIDYLSNQKHLIPSIIDHLWQEWEHDYQTLTNYKTKQDLFDLYTNLQEHSVPTAYVLFENDQFICTCLIDKEDMGLGHPESPAHLFPGKKPWLANVFTHPLYRNRGYAKQLLNSVITNYPTLYLWTFNQKLADYYKQFGFIQKQIIPKHGDLSNIIVMQGNPGSPEPLLV